MKIESTGAYRPILPANQHTQNAQNIIKPLSSNRPQSSVSSPVYFTGERKDIQDIKNMREMQKRFTPETEEILNLAKTIAKQTGASEVETSHIYLASLLKIKQFVQGLDDGRYKIENETRFKLPFVIQEHAAPNCQMLEDDSMRKEVGKVLDKHIKSSKQTVIERGKQTGKKLPRLTNPGFSKSCINDLAEAYAAGANAYDTDSFLDSFLFLAFMISKDRKLVKETRNLSFDIQKSLMVDNSDKKKKNHLEIYDTKADAIWKNVGLGNDVIFLHDSNNRESVKYVISSFTNLINKPGQSYPNIDPENTDIVVLNENANLEFLGDMAKHSLSDPEKSGKTTVIVGDLMQILKNSAGMEVTPEELKVLKNENKKNKNNTKLRLVLALDPESYYANTANGTVMQSILGSYATQRIPTLNASDATKYLTDEAGLRFIESETKKKFSKETVQKAIEISNSDDGNYPDKAINLLKATSKYFVDEPDITPMHIEKYMQEIKSLSEVSGKDKDANIVFDTGKRLSDIVGSPMTKKDAESIVKQIKDGTIGTRGFIAHLDDGSSYGGGRKHTAEAIAGEAGIPMITINARDFALKDIDALSQNANYSELKIKKIISNAKAQAEANQYKTAMIFIENFDNFAANPLYGISSIYEQKAFSQLLAEMDAARKEENINLIIVGSANTPGVIDPNIMKPYKFLNSIIVYPPQDSAQRKEVLEYYLEKTGLEIEGDDKQRDKALRDISDTTQGFTVSDLMYLLDTANTVSRERNKQKIDSADFTEAYLRATTGRPNQYKMSDSWKKIVTSHEAGHAIALEVMHEIAAKQDIEWHLPDKVNFLTLDPRGHFGGAMFHKNSENQTYSFEKMMSDIVCSYGGHSAENTIYNISGSLGISSDIEQITALAKAAVMDFGMGPRTGVAHIERNAFGAPDVSEKKREAIEEDVDSFVHAGKQISDLIIETYKDFILEFTKKYSSRVGTGECIIPAETFREELNTWRQGLSEDEKQKLEDTESEILKIMDKAKKGQ